MCQQCIKEHLESVINFTRKCLLAGRIVELNIQPVRSCTGPLFKAKHRRVCRTKFVYPAPTSAGSVRFTVLLRICGLVIENIETNKVVTVRDMYYQDVGLFRTQYVVSRAIDQLCRLLNVSRRLLNIIPSPNGLIVGDMTIVFEQGISYRIGRANGPSLIPIGSEVFYVSAEPRPRYILIVEKEAVFSHLYEELDNVIIMTGKGFPDHYTRYFLRALIAACPAVPVFALVDSDVHGILIMRTYENTTENTIETYDSVNIQYLGVSLLDYPDGFVNTTFKDKQLSFSTLRKPWIHDAEHVEWKQELQRGLFMGKKAEMNILDRSHLGRLSAYIEGKIKNFNNGKKCETAQQKLPKFVRKPGFVDQPIIETPFSALWSSQSAL